MYPVSADFKKTTGLEPDLLFLVGCQGVHGAVSEPTVMQIGPNPVLMGRHYPLDLAAQCEVKGTLAALIDALPRVNGADAVSGWTKRREKVATYAKTLIEREEKLAREHEGDAVIHPAVLEAHLAEVLPRESVVVQESSTARTALLPFGHGGMTWTRSGGGSLGFGVGAAIGATIAVGRERPVVCHLGDGALGYSAIGFWTMARYRTAMLIVVSNNGSYQIVRHNWANQMPDSKMVRDGKYPGLFLGDPATDYVALARSQGVEGEAVTTVKDLEPAVRRGLDIVTKQRRPYLLDVTVAREDVKFTYERILDPKVGSGGRGYLSAIDHIDTPDAHTVRIVTKQPSASLLAGMAGGWSAIVSREAVEKSDLRRTAMGTGPFILQ